MSETFQSQSGRAAVGLLLLIVMAALIAMFAEYPPWAEWILFFLVTGGVIIAGAAWVYRRYGEPLTTSLRNETETPLTTHSTEIHIKVTVRRPIAFRKVRLVFSDGRRGKRTSHRGDLRITGVLDGNSPAGFEEDSLRLSYSLVEMPFGDDPLFVGPDEPLYWTLLYATTKPWSGRLVFIGYDEDGHRLMASVPIDIRG